MIYLVLLGLDFYDNLLRLLAFFSVIGIVIGIAGFGSYFILYNEAVQDSEKTDVIYKIWSFGAYIVKKKYYLISLVTLTFLMPSPKTITLVTGLYVGEQFVTYIQDSPLAKKAYLLAEKKIDELLDETNSKEGKK